MNKSAAAVIVVAVMVNTAADLKQNLLMNLTWLPV
jgi:hypothetical protein